MSAPNLAIGGITLSAINDKLNYIAGRIQKLLATGDGSLDTTGNAATATRATTAALADKATVLATPRTINGVNFDGSANITPPAPAGTLTGTTLAANVVKASLTHLDISLIPAFANHASAAVGGLVTGDLYRTGGDPDLLAIFD